MRHGHHSADVRNLALHRCAVEKLRAQPELRDLCLCLVEQWLESPRSAARPALEQWREMLLEWTWERIAEVVLDEEKGQTLRQCSPLGPALTPQERWRALERVNRALADEAGVTR